MTDTRITALRRERGWTQERLATESGVGVRTIQRLEAGDDGSLETLRLIARALGVEVRELAVTEEPQAEEPRRWWLVAVGGLAAVGVIGGAAVGLLQPAQAESVVRAKVAIVTPATLLPSPPDYEDQVVKSVAEVTTTSLVLQEADKRLPSPVGERALAASVRSRVLPGTSQIAVTARAATGSSALDRANVVLDALIAQMPLLVPEDSSTQIRITRVGRPEIDDPRVITLLRDGGIGLGGGLLVGALLAVAAHRRRPRRPQVVGVIAVA